MSPGPTTDAQALRELERVPLDLPRGLEVAWLGVSGYRLTYQGVSLFIDPYVSRGEQLEYRRAVLEECERTMTRLADDPHYFARPDRALFADIRRYFPIRAQAQVAWTVREGVGAATSFIEQQVEAGLLDGGVARCHATTRKGKACQRTPLPGRDYCPSHQHLEHATTVAA